MCGGWQRSIENVTKLTHVNFIEGCRLPRITFSDAMNASKGVCRQCRVTDGQYHKFGCISESCPKCGSALMTCDCACESRTLVVRGEAQ